MKNSTLFTYVKFARNFKNFVFPHKLELSAKQSLLQFLKHYFAEKQFVSPDSTIHFSPPILQFFEKCWSITPTEHTASTGYMLHPDQRQLAELLLHDTVTLHHWSEDLTLTKMLEITSTILQSLGQREAYAWDTKNGYHTVYPSQAGCGCYCSALVVFPGLFCTNRVDSAIASIASFPLTYKTIVPHASPLLLIQHLPVKGITPVELGQKFTAALRQLYEEEQSARHLLTKETHFFDRCLRDYGSVQFAKRVHKEEAVHCLASLLSADILGWIDAGCSEDLRSTFNAIGRENILKDNPEVDNPDIVRAQMLQKLFQKIHFK